VRLPLLLLAVSTSLAADGSRESLNFSLVAEDSIGGTGGISASANFTHVRSTGSGSATSTHFSARDGFTSQLASPFALEVSIHPSPPPESTAVQLIADLRLDDGTLEPNVAASWSPIFGPVRSVQPDGTAQTAAVFEDTTSAALATHQGLQAVLTTTVVNVNDDDFEQYGFDGLPDEWQVANFGRPPEPDAAPDANPDGDAYDNEFEYLTGYDPNDSSDFFRFAITSADSKGAVFSFSKFIPGTRYRLLRSPSLFGPPETVVFDRSVRSVQSDVLHRDSPIPATRAFYRVEVTRAP
jgi:hypothetical protein